MLWSNILSTNQESFGKVILWDFSERERTEIIFKKIRYSSLFSKLLESYGPLASNIDAKLNLGSSLYNISWDNLTQIMFIMTIKISKICWTTFVCLRFYFVGIRSESNKKKPLSLCTASWVKCLRYR